MAWTSGPAIALVLIVPADDMMIIRRNSHLTYSQKPHLHIVLCAIITIYVVSTCTMYECMETLSRKYFSSVDNIFVIDTCWHNYRMRTLQSNQIICNIVDGANIQVFVGNNPLNMILIYHLSFKTLGLYHSQEPGHKL